MKIAILTSGILPLPATQGGAVETLTDFVLAYNERHQLHDITVYSIADAATSHHPALQSRANHYHYIDTTSLVARLRKTIYRLTHRQEYYHYTMQYFLHQALKHLRRQHFDLVVIENRPGFALQLAQATQARLVYHLHNDFLNRHVAHAQELYRLADKILTVSDYIARRVRTITPNDAKCVTVHNGIDLDAFSPSHASGPSRRQLGLADDDFVVVFSGRITPEKGILPLIRAMKQASNAEPRLRLLVMGSSFYANAHDAANPFIALLKEEASELQERIVFTGYVPHAQMPGHLRLANCAVVPSVWEEPFGLTCLEAMAMGLPVITTRRGGIGEIASPANAIIIDAPDEPALTTSLSQAMLHLSAHPDECRLMGQAALQRARQFSQEHFAQAFFAALPQPRS